MKGKVITIIGVIIMILVAASYILFEAFVQDTSNVTAQNVVVAKESIEEGTVIHNLEEAQKYFTIKRVSSGDIVEGAIVLNSSDLGDAGLLAKIQDAFSTNTTNTEELKVLIGYKITRNYAPNEQVLVSYLSTDTIEFDSNERLYAIETSYINSVAAEVQEGDYIDLWLLSSENNQTTSKKIIGPLKIYKLKTSDNVTIPQGSSSIPSIVLFKLDEETIEYISTLKSKGTIFFVKYGTKPTKEDIDNALENAKNEDNDIIEDTDEDVLNKIDTNKNDVSQNDDNDKDNNKNNINMNETDNEKNETNNEINNEIIDNENISNEN